MKTLHLLLLSAFAVSATAFAALSSRSSSDLVTLRYAYAPEARDAVNEELGAEGAAVIRAVDMNTNTLTLDPDHSRAEQVRGFLKALDRRPAQVSIDVTLKTKSFDPHTGQTSHRDMKWVVVTRPGTPARIWNGNTSDGETSIDVSVSYDPGETNK